MTGSYDVNGATLEASAGFPHVARSFVALKVQQWKVAGGTLKDVMLSAEPLSGIYSFNGTFVFPGPHGKDISIEATVRVYIQTPPMLSTRS